MVRRSRRTRCSSKQPVSVISANHGSLSLSRCSFRFCTAIKQCSILDPEWDSPLGVPIEGIIFGGRRPAGVPLGKSISLSLTSDMALLLFLLVYESFNWQHGVFVGAAMRSEATAAAEFKGRKKRKSTQNILSVSTRQTNHARSICYATFLRLQLWKLFVTLVVLRKEVRPSSPENLSRELVSQRLSNE